MVFRKNINTIHCVAKFFYIFFFFHFNVSDGIFMLEVPSFFH